MLSPAENYDALIAATRWAIPKRFNIGVAVCDQQPADRPALINVRPDGGLDTYKFGDLRRLTNQLANVFTGLGLTPGERVGILSMAADGSLTERIYFSGVVFSTLGFGDIVPFGPLRLLVAVESITGLMLIAWSATLTYGVLERANFSPLAKREAERSSGRR